LIKNGLNEEAKAPGGSAQTNHDRPEIRDDCATDWTKTIWRRMQELRGFQEATAIKS